MMKEIMSLLNFSGDDGLELHEILGEVANPFGELLGRHRVLVHHPSKGFFGKMNLLDGFASVLGVQFQRERIRALTELLQKARRDCQLVAPRPTG